MDRNFLTISSADRAEPLRGLASPVRLRILQLLQDTAGLNVKDIAHRLDLPQSTVATNVLILEETGLVRSEMVKARKGLQKICHSLYDEIVVRLDPLQPIERGDLIEVAMPVGLYTSYDITAPCGLCAADGIIGLLDVPDFFLDPQRSQAGLIWFSHGYVEYQFPNNARLIDRPVGRLELSLELASEAPGNSREWPSDISVWINGVALGSWTSPSDPGNGRGRLTPSWWKTEASQYGALKTWSIDTQGVSLDGQQISAVSLEALDLMAHHSIRVRIGVEDTARHQGGVNIFGRGFGNHDQDIVMRIHPRAS